MTSNDDRFSELEELERELRGALRRVEAPAGFAERVTLRATGEQGAFGVRRVLAFPPGRIWVGSLAASLLVFMMLVGGVEHRRAVERTRADQDFARSLQIADRAMDQTRQRLQRAGVVMD